MDAPKWNFEGVMVPFIPIPGKAIPIAAIPDLKGLLSPNAIIAQLYFLFPNCDVARYDT